MVTGHWFVKIAAMVTGPMPIRHKQKKTNTSLKKDRVNCISSVPRHDTWHTDTRRTKRTFLLLSSDHLLWLHCRDNRDCAPLQRSRHGEKSHFHRKREGINQRIIITLKGEVRAIGRFWVFDGNGLLGHQLIDSRWFEKNPPTESGWKRRSKNRRSTGISRGNDRDVMSAFDFAPIYTPFDQHGFFAFDFGRFVDRWWLKEVWYAPDFLPNHCTVATLAVRKRNTRLEWTNLPWHASQKSRLWPVCR